MLNNVDDGGRNMDTSLIDLNARPRNVHGQTSNNQVIFYIPLYLCSSSEPWRYDL